MNGFSYCGTHTNSLGIYYVPDATGMGDFYANYKTIDEQRAWHDGGDFYRNQIEPRVFELSCFYDRVSYATREKILRWLDRRTKGWLIFDDRPWVRYYVRPTKKPEFSNYYQHDGETNAYSGTFSITFTAYDPFGELLITSSDSNTPAEVIAETGVLPASKMPAGYTGTSVEFLVYNPGTEQGHTEITFKGSTGSSDLKITNTTNGDVFVLKSGLTTAQNGYYKAYSKTGRIERTDNNGTTLDYAYHDEGYITLDPCFPIWRNVSVSYTSGARGIESSTALFEADMIGKWIYLEDEWKYINAVTDSQHAQVSTEFDSTDTETSDIVTMNYLEIEKANNAVVTQLSVVCKPEVR